MLKIKMYAANDGDAFLLQSTDTHILIDGGYASTFNREIAKDLRTLASENKQLDLVIVTHIDADHIGGLVRLFSENGAAAKPNLIMVKQIWHNSLRSLTTRCCYEIPSDQYPLLQAINKRGHPSEMVNKNSEAEAEKISAKQGSALARLIFEGGYSWNGGNGVTPVIKGYCHHFEGSADSISVLTPSESQLNKLLEFWKKYLYRAGFRVPSDSGELIDDAFEFTLEHIEDEANVGVNRISSTERKSLEEIYIADTSPTNGSSISLVFEADGKRLLMLADAWAEDVIQSLQEMEAKGVSMLFDAIKISHHGSYRNTSPELLKMIDAPIYFISTDGSKHDHPDDAVLNAIVDRPSEFTRTLYFNYSTAASRKLHSYSVKTKTKFLVIENVMDWIDIGNEN